MSTLIVYASKYGCTEKCAQKLAEKISDAPELVNLKTTKQVDLAKYDRVIIGGSIYMGKIRAEVKRFCSDYLEQLKVKTLGLFICGIRNGEAAENELAQAFPPELLSSAIAKECFGGELIYSRMGFLDRQITKMVAKSGDASFPTLDAERNASIIDEHKIDRFARDVNAA